MSSGHLKLLWLLVFSVFIIDQKANNEGENDFRSTSE